MRKSYRYFAAWLIAGTISIAAFAQNIIVSGTVHNNSTKETVPAVSVLVKGTNQGTYTDDKGNFKITIGKLPVTLVFSSIGYDDNEISVTTASSSLTVDLTPATTLGQEVVIAATRTPQRILESPVSIEKVKAEVKNKEYTVNEVGTVDFFDPKGLEWASASKDTSQAFKDYVNQRRNFVLHFINDTAVQVQDQVANQRERSRSEG